MPGSLMAHMMNAEVSAMKEINIAKVLVGKRKAKGITQDELANYMGVSKASVSKWETGQSYPDVTFLPMLAAYFNISVDELIDYQPQMTSGDIRKLYRRLAAGFTEKPFDTVLAECREVVRKYYACFPLLLRMGILLVNHLELVPDAEKSAVLIAEAKALFIRVREESGDATLGRQATFMEAICALSSGDPGSAIDLLDDSVAALMPPESLLAAAYQMKGRPRDAKGVLQFGMYQYLVVLFNFFPAYLRLCADDASKYEETLRRTLVVAEAFDMKHLHPGVLIGTYLTAAEGYVAMGNKVRALDMLQQYAEIVTGDVYPMRLHNDTFFDMLEDWLEKIDVGTDMPRDDQTIRKSMSQVVGRNPVFATLSGDPRFEGIKEKLDNMMEENHNA